MPLDQTESLSMNQLSKFNFSSCCTSFIAVSLSSFSFLISNISYADVNSSSDHHLRILGEFVYMKREDIHNHTLVKDTNKPPNSCGCSNTEVIDTKDLVNRMGFEPGFRTALIYSENLERSYEANFLYLQPWHAKKKVKGDADLKFPFTHQDYTQDYIQASEATATYSMFFWDLELNFWRHFTPRYIDFFSLSGIAGLRYFHWNERFELTMRKPPDKSDYAIRTKNDIFGLQLGLNFQMNPMPWLSWEATAKIGGMADHGKQHTFLGDQDNQVVLRNFQKQKWDVGMFIDLAALLAFQFKEHLNLHVGYQFLFFSGLILAPEQISKNTGSSAGRRVYDDGTAIIHGLFAGMTVSF